MSKLTYLEKLLDGAKISWKPLGDENYFEIANSARKPVKASLRDPGIIPYYGANNIQDYVDGYTHDGEYVLIAEDGSASLENYSIQYTRGKIWANNHVHVVRGRSSLDTRFLYHYLRTVNFIPFLTGGGRAKLTKGKMVEILIPVPCPDDPVKSLKIQGEIVRILDVFTEITAELIIELNARKKQYTYYRDKLLALSDIEMEWKPLEDLCHFISSGKNKKKSPEGKFPVFGSTGVIARTDEYAYDGKQILVARVGANAGYVHLADGKYDVSDNTIIVNVKENYSLKFLFYILASMNLRQYAKGGGQPLITSGQLKELKIPVPYPNIPEKSLAAQARIVTILDKFDTLTTSFTEGLPREIELRQKQYEYYRELLLSFPKEVIDE